MRASRGIRRLGRSSRAPAVVAILAGALLIAGASSAGAQGPTCFGKAPTIVAKRGAVTTGTNGADVIVGTGGADVIRGLRGRDLICARGGSDTVRAGAGDDRVDGGAGADTVAGGFGRDRVLGGGGGDRLLGERGDDTLTGGAGRDAVTGGPGRDVMRGDAGDDTVGARDGVAEWPKGGSGRDVAIVDDLDRPAGFEEVRRPPTPLPPGRDEGVDFDTHVRTMAGLLQEGEAAAVELGRGPEESSGDYVCTTIKYKAAPGYDELFLMDPASDVIYPGSIIYGDTITSGAYIPLVADRAPMAFSLSLENISGSPARTVAQPSLSTVRTAINDILAGEVTGATPARINYEIDEVFSQEQLALSLGANYKNPAVKVAAAFDYGKEDVRSRVVVKFQQIYYTIDIDLPASPAAMFRTLTDAGALGTASPMYVSTVTYGRQILFTAESSYSASEVAAALAAGFKNAAQSVSFEVGARHERVLENSSLKAYVLGGSGGQAAGAVVAGVDGLNALIATGGDYSRQSPGAPLSYKLRYLKDNAVARIILASEYNVRQCDRVRHTYTVTLDRIHWDQSEEDGEAEVYGNVAFSLGGDSTDLWRIDDPSDFLEIEKGTAWPGEGGGVIGERRVTVAKAADGTFPDHFTISGRLLEYDDPGGDDDLGLRVVDIPRSAIDTGTYQRFLGFNGRRNLARIEYSIVPAD